MCTYYILHYDTVTVVCVKHVTAAIAKLQRQLLNSKDLLLSAQPVAVCLPLANEPVHSLVFT